MIRHIVLFSAKDAGDVEAIRAGLRRLADIPAAALLEVEFNACKDDLSNEIDVVVYGEFADEAALNAFKEHPIYHETIAVVRPLRDLRFVADFEAPPS
jgi:Stress responsive A/B Barrel Domain